MERILVIGAAGQIGSELTLALRKIYDNENVFATDLRMGPPDVAESGPFHILDVMDDKRLIHFVIEHKITQIYHLAAVLSGNAEKLPLQAWHINMSSLMNILDLAKEVDEITGIFWPSSIAVFGPSTPKENTPQTTVMEPNTVYGISKLAGERWCEYYSEKYGVDVRSLRYPGLISHKTEAGGGTTDYAVEIFYDAVSKGTYESFIDSQQEMPMMYMEDAIEATIALMQAPIESLKVKSAYNIAGLSFTPEQLANEIKKHIPGFTISYKPDFRQKIAESWPCSVDASVATKDWGHSSKYDLEKMTELMIREIRKRK